MLELFGKRPEFLFLISMFLCGTLIALTAIVVYNWRRVRQTELEASLKQDMLNRGLSVDDIERVLRASSAPPAEQTPAKPETITDNEYALVEKLVDEGKSADEIARIIVALKGPPEPRPVPEHEHAIAARESGWKA